MGSTIRRLLQRCSGELDELTVIVALVMDGTRSSLILSFPLGRVGGVTLCKGCLIKQVFFPSEMAETEWLGDAAASRVSLHLISPRSELSIYC